WANEWTLPPLNNSHIKRQSNWHNKRASPCRHMGCCLRMLHCQCQCCRLHLRLRHNSL
ncbi:hypothetical protein ACJX0J_041627, partial [Zea mays]